MKVNGKVLLYAYLLQGLKNYGENLEWFKSLNVWTTHFVVAVVLNYLAAWKFEPPNPAGVYFFKINNGITRTMCENYSKLIIEALERWQ